MTKTAKIVKTPVRIYYQKVIIDYGNTWLCTSYVDKEAADLDRLKSYLPVLGVKNDLEKVELVRRDNGEHVTSWNGEFSESEIEKAEEFGQEDLYIMF